MLWYALCMEGVFLFTQSVMEQKKTKYEKNVLPRIEEISAWAKVGVSDENIAKNLKVAYSTFRKYCAEHEELAEVMKNAKGSADAQVVNAAWKRATGYTVSVKKAFKVRTVTYKDGKRVKEEEHMEYADEEQYIPPTDPSIDRWLLNRKKEEWQNIRSIKVDLPEDSKITVEMGEADGYAD